MFYSFRNILCAFLSAMMVVTPTISLAGSKAMPPPEPRDERGQKPRNADNDGDVDFTPEKERFGPEIAGEDDSDGLVLFKSPLSVEEWRTRSLAWKSLSSSAKEALISETAQTLMMTAAAGSSLYLLARTVLTRVPVPQVAAGVLVAAGLGAMVSTANAEETLAGQLTPGAIDRFYTSYGLAKETLALHSKSGDLLKFHNELAKRMEHSSE